jgi:hypothetical protein
MMNVAQLCVPAFRCGSSGTVAAAATTPMTKK